MTVSLNRAVKGTFGNTGRNAHTVEFQMSANRDDKRANTASDSPEHATERNIPASTNPVEMMCIAPMQIACVSPDSPKISENETANISGAAHPAGMITSETDVRTLRTP